MFWLKEQRDFGLGIGPADEEFAMDEADGDEEIEYSGEERVNQVGFIRIFDEVEVEHLGKCFEGEIKKEQAQKPNGQTEYVFRFHPRVEPSERFRIRGGREAFKFFGRGFFMDRFDRGSQINFETR